MKLYFSPTYHAFHCIANACPDSCCTDWEVVLDEVSEQFYRTLPGSLGEQLRSVMTVDEDGDTIFQEKNGICPFWNKNHLCDIQSALGENALCETCRLFPRITQDYGDFVEYDLSIACPEAARLLLHFPLSAWTLTEEQHPELQGDTPTYAPMRMKQLYQQRETLFSLLKDASRPAVIQLAECLAIQLQWENMHIANETEICSEKVCLHFLSSCEILTEDWKTMLKQANANPDGICIINTDLDREIRLFAMDVLYRYYFRSVFEETAVFPVQLTAFLVCAGLTVISRLTAVPQSESWRIWQLLVKEVEYDSDNMERLEMELKTEPCCSPTAICRQLRSMGSYSL